MEILHHCKAEAKRIERNAIRCCRFCCFCWCMRWTLFTRKKRRKRAKSMGPHGREGESIRMGISAILNREIDSGPEHLVIMVNGIIGSSNDWDYAAEQFGKRLGGKVAIHCSVSSAALQTFDGVDVMGKRLADEVQEVIDDTPGVKKISFLAHSLGGLVARYAISLLYRPPKSSDPQRNDVMDPTLTSDQNTEVEQSEFTIGGLQPENFITLATPHLGCRSSKQLPFLLGIQVFEKSAPFLAYLFVGQTGKHLFLNDGSESELPLLRKMATDCKEGQFASSLRAFKYRTAYANVTNDQMVGWRTSSIRRKSDMPQITHQPVDPKYPHIVRDEEPGPPTEPLGFPVIDGGIFREDEIEEEIVTFLNQSPWRRVDVSFRGAPWGYQGHNLIQVQKPRIHMGGMDVIEHILDKHFVEKREIV